MLLDDPLVIGGRASPLALWQSRLVQAKIAAEAGRPEDDDELISVRFPVRGLTSEADTDLSTPLSQFSNKGVFSQNLDRALAANEIDVAVHSFKDLPTTLPPGLMLAAVLAREYRHDVVVLNSRDGVQTLDDLPPGSRIATSSVRRQALLARYYPHLVCVDVRGNIQTRLARLRSGHADGLILAAAALHRLDLQDQVAIELTDWPYAVSQGALAVVCRESDARSYRLAHAINDYEMAMVCTAERAFLRMLEGGCKAPIGVRAHLTGGVLTMYGVVVSLDGKDAVEKTMTRPCAGQPDADRIGQRLAIALQDLGASVLLEEVRRQIDAASTPSTS